MQSRSAVVQKIGRVKAHFIGSFIQIHVHVKGTLNKGVDVITGQFPSILLGSTAVNSSTRGLSCDRDGNENRIPETCNRHSLKLFKRETGSGVDCQPRVITNAVIAQCLVIPEIILYKLV
ncbi:hypothetical protein BDEG_24732 [Batrachochytrium dendrobatidis JEL423]|uniref:Uncharacterized protein n=1 Tax=Batrachochytrium dendrobatidis (strain JEL423) TaxID=403673 RepID=A0A177WMQ6_BATDL|nr:hypothetical protein BDEG_24732 [Batrachochytrium dendrobatidis JEL423]